ncbi:hypothetical protein F7P74_03600 [Helicobacter pullorum NCTC 12824]|uniref:hypothetical protein n=2 Tax=Helicobacter pullorum TaxID=35818 RepID=UPI0006BAD014|nr:hypothetical protein [Helicobacter pullorum]KAB0575211.1 hypothetical protein F7P74_03600 [Helicobacter pullorum NCTC 12824]KPH53207.1 hypothetical protein HPU229313_02770 [Helicobacter pullorum]
MQTFSSMRRNSTDKKNLTIFFIVIGIVVYVSISDIFYLLPPLFGVAYILTQEKYESGDFGAFYFLVPFFIFFEASKGLPFLSTILFMAFSFKVILPKFRKFFGYSRILTPLFILYGYFGYFAFLNFFGAIFDYNVPEFSWILGFYALIEIILVWLFLWII